MSMTTELAQRMKAAALNATPGRLGDRIDGTGSIKYQCFGNDGSLVLQTDHKNMRYGFIGPNSKADELFFRVCSPENVLALVGANESVRRTLSVNHEAACTLIDENEALKQKIAELEESHAQVIQSRDHYKRMSEEGLKSISEARMSTEKRIAELHISRDKCFLSGLKTGWEYSIAYDTEGYNREIADAQAVIDRAAGVAVEGDTNANNN
ncbi:hypothetical protein P3T83_24945 [Pseudocitrobacter sp. 2023EL-00150]|uniref:hypothetical protein n=1 Tax=Pseudocitrobacter sp. 2023EL-00150 TaxID=3032322 RepID=UPI0023E404EA|nr:hypothetical protein [Pseudocitrobacter sp. 2023EL-00150]MDF3830932.1 hypothetical protein [Pseudocitrobacter sp. 2023EL-00150]